MRRRVPGHHRDLVHREPTRANWPITTGSTPTRRAISTT